MLKLAKMTTSVLAIGCLLSVPAAANLSASPIIMTYAEDGQNRKDITLSNSGNRPQYLEITAYRIAKPGVFPEELVGDPDPKNVGLLVAPRRVALKPGEQKIIRVILLEDTAAEDQAWRVHIKPAKVEIEASSSGAMVQLGYKALIISRPKGANISLNASRSGNILTVKNSGNTNALLYQGEQCDAGGKDCKTIAGKRLWPGGSYTVKLPHASPVKFKLLGPDGETTVQY